MRKPDDGGKIGVFADNRRFFDMLKTVRFSTICRPKADQVRPKLAPLTSRFIP